MMLSSQLVVLACIVSSVGSLRSDAEDGKFVGSGRDQDENTTDGSVFRFVFSQEQPAATSALAQTPSSYRRAYFDLGANWANTLRLYKTLGDSSHVQQHPWEVYGFEASPLIVDYLDQFVGFLNGDRQQPALLWPPSGSSGHLAMYAPRYGCPARPGDRMRNCMWKVFKEPLKKMKPNQELMTAEVVKSRVAMASSPPTGDKDRFVLVPAAAGASEGSMHLGMVDPGQMIRGGALDNEHTGDQVDVPIADFVSMLTDNFKKEDYIVVKMDIEGGEFDVMNRLVAEGKAYLIDVLALECHSDAGDCPQLLEKWKKSSTAKLVQESAGYEGWDSESTPEKYYPIDPRNTR